MIKLTDTSRNFKFKNTFNHRNKFFLTKNRFQGFSTQALMFRCLFEKASQSKCQKKYAYIIIEWHQNINDMMILYFLGSTKRKKGRKKGTTSKRTNCRICYRSHLRFIQ